MDDRVIILPEMLLQAYASGIFPMAESRDSADVQWVEPRRRGIIPLAGFKVSRNVLAKMRNQPYAITYNQAFEAVMQACAARESTWISQLILDSYATLHRLGYAHSTEVWLPDAQNKLALVGGQYGVSLGGAYFGESMFKRAPDADKVALYYTHQRLAARGFVLWDTQFWTAHLGTLGGVEISQQAYLQLLAQALRVQATFAP